MRGLKLKVWIAAMMVLSILSSSTLHADRLPIQLDGSMMPYDFASVDPNPQWPDTLRPVYGAYIARHGARYISSSRKVTDLQDILREAHRLGRLTQQGRDFYAYLDTVSQVTAGRWGALSEVGMAEERKLADQLIEILTPLQRNVSLSALSSYVPRVVMSMYEFSHRLSQLNTDLNIYTAEGKRFSPLLRFFETDAAYRNYRTNGLWRQASERYVDKTVPEGPAYRLVGEGEIGGHSLRQISMMMYDILQSNPAMGLPQADTRYMSIDEFRACWNADCYEQCLRNCNSLLTDLPMMAVGPLLQEIVVHCDDALSADDASETDIKCDAYFGHAETLMPLLSTLRLPGCSLTDPALEHLTDRWRNYDVVPLGANLLIVLLRSERGEYYAALRLNGRNTPLHEGLPLIIPWETLRTAMLRP